VRALTVIALLVVAGTALGPRAALAGFDPTEESPGLGNQLSVLSLEVEGASAGAGRRLVELWAGSGRGLIWNVDGSLVSLAGWVEGLKDRTALLKAVDAGGGASVLPTVRAAANDPAASPLDLYAKVRSVGIATDTGEALAIVADRALAWGDAVSANDLYTAAQTAGWKPGADRASSVQLAAVPATPVSALPTVAPWFNDPKALLSPRVFPVSVGDTTYIAGTAGLVAVKGNAVLWTNRWGDADDISAGAPLPGGAGRGPFCVPAVLAANGAAQILIVNTPVAVDLNGTLRAVRASDGRTLWDSTDDESHVGLRFVGPATIAGRYVYAPAVASLGTSTTLMLVCMDVTSGKSLWQTPLGLVVDTAHNSNRRPLEHHWHQSAPRVVGEHVFVAPGVGYVFSIGRFDGIIRWGRPYEVTEAPEPDVRRFRDAMRSRQNATPPIHPLQAQRYASGVVAVGNVLVVAPLDAPTALGLDVATGKVLWERKEMDPPTLVGRAGANVVFAGGNGTGVSVAAIDPATGQNKWTTPAGTSDIRGPLALVGNQVLAPTLEGLQTLDAASGAATATAPSPLAEALKSDSTRAVLTTIGALNSIQLPLPKK